jgi:hypothetical protein
LFRFLSADQALAPSGALALERCGGVGGLNSLSSVRNPDCVGTVKGIADRVAVIDGGRIVEEGTVWSVFTNPRSETTRSLLSTIRPQLPDHIAQRLGQTPGGEAVISVDLAGPEAIFSALRRSLGRTAEFLPADPSRHRPYSGAAGCALLHRRARSITAGSRLLNNGTGSDEVLMMLSLEEALGIANVLGT